MATAVIVLTVLSHIIVPLALLVWVALSRGNSRLYWLLILLITISYLATFHVIGAGWSWFGRLWPWAYWAGLVLAVGHFLYHRWPIIAWLPARKIKPVLGTITVGALALFWAIGLPSLIGLRDYDGEAVELYWPLHDATFMVIHGGAKMVSNHHVVVDAQRYALDVVQLNRFGTRAAGLLPQELDAYEIFATPLRAPCEGEVLASVDGIPDQNPMEMDPDNLLGNHVTIYCHDVTILFAHIREGSVAVAAGDSIRPGEVLGEVGNSGNTSEPHLHLHAVRGRVVDEQELAFTGEAVPMTFNGRFFRRNDRIQTQ